MVSSDEEGSRRRRKSGDKKRRRSESRSRSRERGRSRSRSRSDSRERRKSRKKDKAAKRSPSPSRDKAPPPPKTKADPPPPAAEAPKKKSRFSEPASNIAPPPTIPTIDMAAVSLAAAQAQAKAAEIAMRMGVGGMPTHTAVTAPQPLAVTPAIGVPGQAAALQEQIRRQLEQLRAQGLSVGVPTQPAANVEKKPVFKPLRFDEFGREIDEEGNLVKMDLSSIRTVKANIAPTGAKKELDKPKEAENPYLTKEEDDEPAVVDPRLKVKDRSRRQSRAFAFVKPGTFVKQAEKIRDKERSRILAGFASGRNARAYSYSGLIEEEEGGDKTAGELAPSMRLQALPPAPDHATASVPNVEWWDEPFLPRDKRVELAKDPSAYPHMSLESSKTFTYVQHPVPLRGMYERKGDTVAMPTYLTKKERKRLRKQARAEREREKRDKIALGLMPPPPPKLTVANVMKVLSNESIADPSKAIAQVQRQIEERKRNHEMRNLAKKLTPEEKREKKRKKIIADKAKQTEVALFRVRDLSSPKIRYKIDVNAQQTGLSGAVVTCKDPIFGDEGLSLVVVEGGPKAVRRYVKLMLRRIKWDAKDDEEEEDDMGDDDDEDDDDHANASGGGTKKCEMVWKGIVPKPVFTGFKFQECRTVTTARKVLESRNVAHYWDMCVRAGDGLPPGI